MLVQILKAIFAAAARAAGIDGNPVADCQCGDALTQRFDRTGNLMTEDNRLFDPDRPETAIVIIMQIGATNATRPNPDEDLSPPRFFGVFRLDAQVMHAIETADPGAAMGCIG